MEKSIQLLKLLSENRSYSTLEIESRTLNCPTLCGKTTRSVLSQDISIADFDGIIRSVLGLQGDIEVSFLKEK